MSNLTSGSHWKIKVRLLTIKNAMRCNVNHTGLELRQGTRMQSTIFISL